MTRLSFAIVVLIFFNPVIEVWRLLIEMPPALQVFGFTVRMNSPYVGVIYLILVALVSWVALTLLFFGLETYWMKGISRRPAFRDGVILASVPSLIYFPEVLAKYLFWLLLIKLLIVSLIDLLLKIPGLAGLLGPNFVGMAMNAVNAVRGLPNGQVLELMMLALCLLLLLLKHFFYLEKDYVYFDEIKKVQRERFKRELDPDAQGLMRGVK